MSISLPPVGRGCWCFPGGAIRKACSAASDGGIGVGPVPGFLRRIDTYSFTDSSLCVSATEIVVNHNVPVIPLLDLLQWKPKGIVAGADVIPLHLEVEVNMSLLIDECTKSRFTYIYDANAMVSDATYEPCFFLSQCIISIFTSANIFGRRSSFRSHSMQWNKKRKAWVSITDERDTTVHCDGPRYWHCQFGRYPRLDTLKNLYLR